MPEIARVEKPHIGNFVTGEAGKCLACGKQTDKRGFVDFQVNLDETRRIYMCADCFYDAARQMGCLNPDQAQNLTERLAAGQSTISQLQAELEESKRKSEILDRINDAYHSTAVL